MSSDERPRPEYEVVFGACPGNYLLLDPDLIIVGVTNAYLATTMTVRDQILGRPLFEVFPDNPEDPTADGVRNLRESLGRVLAGRQPDRMPVQKYDIQRPGAAGGGFEERYWSPINSPVLRPDGSVQYIVHSVEDVTEYMRLKRDMQREQEMFNEELRAEASKIEAEQFLRIEAVEANKRLTESERQYRFLANAVPHLIWTADTDGLIQYCNDRCLSFTGLPVEQLRGSGWQRTLHPEDRDRTVAAWAEAVGFATRYHVEHRMRYHDNSWRWVLSAAVPYRRPDGSIHMWLGTTTDIHDRVTAEAQLRQTQKLQAVGKLAGGMAHEVNNMMSIVLGFGELVLESLGPDHPQRGDVEEMVRAGERATAVTQQLLAFSRQQVLKPTVVDVNLIVAELTPALVQVLGSDRRLEVIPASQELRVVTDRGQIEQVLINLMANARDATDTGSLVVVKCSAVEMENSTFPQGASEPGWFVRLAVRDDGVGMTQEVLARAFEPFFTTKAAGKGTGLGLSMVHGVVKQSGGQVRISSTPGEGTTVAVYLPLVEAEVTRAEPAASVPPGTGETVLVVEDEPAVRSLARRVLELHGYTVYQAPNGGAALDFVTSHPGEVDLVLTDIVMPRMNGRELAEQLAERAPGLPVIFMSGYTEDEIGQRGVVAGALPGTSFLPKPITPESLALAVRDRLKQTHQAFDTPA